MSHLYSIFHAYDLDGGFGDAVPTEDLVGVVEATEEEITKFLEVWDKPRIYDRPYSDLREHNVYAKKVLIQDLNEIRPYDPFTRDWPDMPEDGYGKYWNGREWVDAESAYGEVS